MTVFLPLFPSTLSALFAFSFGTSTSTSLCSFLCAFPRCPSFRFHFSVSLVSLSVSLRLALSVSFLSVPVSFSSQLHFSCVHSVFLHFFRQVPSVEAHTTRAVSQDDDKTRVPWSGFAFHQRAHHFRNRRNLCRAETQIICATSS